MEALVNSCHDVEEETPVQELSAHQLEWVCAVKEPKFPELQFSRGYALDGNHYTIQRCSSNNDFSVMVTLNMLR